MNISKLLMFSLAFSCLWSCDDNKMEWGRDPQHYPVSDDEIPDMEGDDEDIVLDESKGLKDYITDSNFKFGIGMGMSLYTSASEDRYRTLANDNFNDVAAGYAMKHGPMINTSDGSIKTSSLDRFFDMTKENGLSIFGHCLIWHSNQNADYMNNVVAEAKGDETTEPGGDVTTNVLFNYDFEDGNTHCNVYEGGDAASQDNVPKSEIVDEGYAGGKCLKLFNEAIDNNPQFHFSQAAFAVNLENGKQYKVTMFAKGTSGGLQFQYQDNSYSSDGYAILSSINESEWSEFSHTFSCGKDNVDKIILDFGLKKGPFYIDNLKIEEIVESPLLLTDGNDDEATRVENAVKAEMQRWIDGMITYCYQNAQIVGWDVVNEPMDDGKPSQIKTTPKSNVPNDAFYWQDYFKTPREYAYWAFRYARETYEKLGVTDPKLFINDYNLEYNIKKCEGIIAYINEIEALEIDGVRCKVDGIATQMHIDINTNKDNIKKMFELMANTGKLVKISELDIKVNPDSYDQKPPTFVPTSELLTKQAEMYKYVIDTYFEVVPKAQQYGITIWSLTDGYVEHENWIPNDAPNLWDANFQPKEAYYSVAKALAKEYGTGESSESVE